MVGEHTSHHTPLGVLIWGVWHFSAGGAHVMVVFYLFLHFLAPMEHLVLVTGGEMPRGWKSTEEAGGQGGFPQLTLSRKSGVHSTRRVTHQCPQSICSQENTFTVWYCHSGNLMERVSLKRLWCVLYVCVLRISALGRHK